MTRRQGARGRAGCACRGARHARRVAALGRGGGAGSPPGGGKAVAPGPGSQAEEGARQGASLPAAAAATARPSSGSRRAGGAARGMTALRARRAHCSEVRSRRPTPPTRGPSPARVPARAAFRPALRLAVIFKTFHLNRNKFSLSKMLPK